jgi:hypothetical protein
MAVLYISEYKYIASVDTELGVRDNPTPVAQEPAVAEQHVAIGAGSVQSAAFGPNTHMIRVHTDAICSIAIGANPTAVATAKRLAANQTEYFGVQPGHLIAVITNT